MISLSILEKKHIYKGTKMKCVICRHGETSSGKTTVTLDRDDITFVSKKVPAMICLNCGEEYFDEEITSYLLETSEDIFNSGSLIDIRYYKAA